MFLRGEVLAVLASLHELDDADPVALSQGAQSLAEGGGRLPFPVSRVKLDQTPAVPVQDGLSRILRSIHLHPPDAYPLWTACTRFSTAGLAAFLRKGRGTF
jgi:hypothetical protein